MAHLDAVTDLLDPPVFVVTARAGDGTRAGCLVGFASQCSIDPEGFMVWLSRRNHTYEVACRSAHLAVHVLSRARLETARLFAEETGHRVDKFARTEWTEGPHGTPLLADADAWFVGRVEERTDGGDHVGFRLTPVAGGSSGPEGRADEGRPRALRLGDVLHFSPGHPA
ncbi:flavin reductase family protein [Streptomyces sp.]|uniref:flavin reductase family protein n=2 Tax=Streptomyces sp. TaxID=1931 RepID=UPI002811EBA3|nr:flavin reductase family protein [Streptomyces sp.]